MQAAVRILRNPVRSHFRPASVRVSCNGVGATRKVAPSICAPAFLTQKIHDIYKDKASIKQTYGIDIGSSCDHVLKCCKRFARLAKMNFDFAPDKTTSEVQNLGRLIDEFGEAIRQFGLEFFVSKKTPQGEEVGVLECAVYREGVELDNEIVILYVAPARYLSPRSAELFKRFMKFFSDSTHIPLGIINNRENFYIDGILSMYEDYPYCSELTEDDDDYPDVAKCRNISAAYNEDGDFWNLFDEIGSLPRQDAKVLYQDLDEYRKDCPNNELALIEVMAEGIDIIKDMNAYWFEFNPEDDGLPDDYGNTDGDGWSSSVFASAILYSEHDGIAEKLLLSINGDVNSGVNLSGWNIHQYLSPNVEKSVIDEFMACRDNVGRFSLWLQQFYRETKKFDRYGKSEEHFE